MRRRIPFSVASADMPAGERYAEEHEIRVAACLTIRTFRELGD
jgi:hypothetical protein